MDKLSVTGSIPQHIHPRALGHPGSAAANPRAVDHARNEVHAYTVVHTHPEVHATTRSSSNIVKWSKNPYIWNLSEFCARSSAG